VGRPCRAAWEWEFYRLLGAKIIAARGAHNPPLSRRELADLAGLDQPLLWYWEKGKRGMGVAALQRIADALGVTSTSLIPPLDGLNVGDLAFAADDNLGAARPSGRPPA
jgi:transcriptional regulator with XRE-family HTH domain